MGIDTVISFVVLCIVIIFLLFLIVWDRLQTRSRENSLLDRLMSRDFAEYVEGQRRMQVKPPASDGRVSIEEAANALAEEGLLADTERSPAAVVRVS